MQPPKIIFNTIAEHNVKLRNWLDLKQSMIMIVIVMIITMIIMIMMIS